MGKFLLLFILISGCKNVQHKTQSTSGEVVFKTPAIERFQGLPVENDVVASNGLSTNQSSATASGSSFSSTNSVRTQNTEGSVANTSNSTGSGTAVSQPAASPVTSSTQNVSNPSNYIGYVIDPDLNKYYDIKRFFPAPVSGTAYIVEFDYSSNFNSGNISDPSRAILMQRYFREPDGTYRLQDFSRGWPTTGYTWLSTWSYKFDAQRGIIEFTDDAINREDFTSQYNVKFREGNELLWGNYLKKGELVQGTLYHTTQTYTDKWSDPYSNYGYVWTQLKEAYKTYTIGNRTFNNVVKLRNFQSFCENSECSSRKDFYVEYFMAEGLGFIQLDWWDSTGTYKIDSAYFNKNCRVDLKTYYCK